MPNSSDDRAGGAPPVNARTASRGLLAVVLVAIGVLTLVPGDPEAPTSPLTCVLACGDRGVADVILNVALFVPLGVALRGLGWRARKAYLFALALTIFVESAQFFLPGRDSSFSDVIANALGAALGYELARRALTWLEPGGRGSLSFSGFVLGCWLATGYLLQPALPDGPYYGQWTPRLPSLAPYAGRVLGAAVGPLEIPDGRLSASDSFRVLWQAGRALDVAVVAGPASERFAPILRIVTDDAREVVLVGAREGDLAFRHWTNGRRWRLDWPEARVPGALRGLEPADTFRISAQRLRERVCLSVGARESCSLGGAVGSGWSLLLYPNAWPNWRYTALDLIWLLGLVFPIGLWAPSARWLAAQSALLLSCALILPPVTPLLPTSVLEAAGILIGLALGYGARTCVGRRLGTLQSGALPP